MAGTAGHFMPDKIPNSLSGIRTKYIRVTNPDSNSEITVPNCITPETQIFRVPFGRAHDADD